MATETVIWTALPNGVINRDGELLAQLSLFVSLRLEASAAEGDTLSLYANVRHWTDTLTFLRTVQLEFDGGVTVDAVPVVSWEARWWEGLFNDQTFVRPYQFKDYTDRLIISYPVKRILNYLKQTYQRIGLESPNDLPDLLGREGQYRFADPNSYSGFEWSKQLARETRQRLARQLFHGGGRLAGTISEQEFGYLIEMQGEASDPKQDLQQLMLFHYPPERLNTTAAEDEAAVTEELPPLPKTEAEFERYLDFHEVISSLGDYPVLLRKLGLVIDVTLPLSAIPANTQFVRATPQWESPNIVLTSRSPRTAVAFNSPHRLFRTRQNPAIFPRIQQGQLQLDPAADGADLVEVDVDGAALKLIGTMNTIGASAQLLANDTAREGGLPTLRSAGLSLNLSARAARLFAHFKRTLATNNSPSLDDAVFYAEDVLRGYIVDVWDSATERWHSLCARIGSYRIENTDLVLDNVPDEGFAQMAMTEQAPPAEGKARSTDLYVHESLFRWDGWSLVAPRPGKTIGEQGDSNSPTVDPEPQPMLPFKLITSFKAAPRSLPRLRFGIGYRMRVRVADLAGNALALNDGDDESGGVSTSASASDAFAIPAPARNPLYYLRYEPVGTPTVYLRQAITFADAGESLARMVIRTYNDSLEKDAQSVSATSERHIAPPPTGELMLETHGLLDDLAGRLKNDPATYALIAARELTVTNDDTSSPVFSEPELEITYLPDPLSVGAALRNLPGTPNGTLGKVDVAGTLAWQALEGINVRPGSASLIPFDPDPAAVADADADADVDPLTALLNRQSFRLILSEHPGGTFQPPLWDNDERTLTLYLPKAEETSFALSSFIRPDQLKLMGVWQWIREYIDTQIQQNLGSPWQLEELSKRVVACVQYALEGGHWMLTPARPISIVHAVQQPLGVPRMLLLLAQRSAGETSTNFVGILQVHGKSTLTFNILAHWDEPLDDPRDERAKDGPITLTFDRQVDELSLKSLAAGTIPGSRLDKFGNKLPIGTYNPTTDTVQFGVADGQLASPVHEFGDTKHRQVTYQLVAGSRFREYFANDTPGGFTRTSETVVVNVPSSARPAAPQVRYVIPTYGWKRDVSTNLIGSYREGGGLRVYLERDWYSSGAGELLGVVLWRGSVSNNDQRHALTPYITQWGMDPIWGAAPLPNLPGEYYFLNKVTADGTTATLPELSSTKLSTDNSVTIVGFPVEYDEDRHLWYSDIAVDSSNTYYPFIRLALVRYQPHSIAEKHISTVTLAEFAQLAPDRAAILTFDPYDPDSFNLVVSGYSYKRVADAQGSPVTAGSRFVIRVERRDPDLADDLAWQPFADVTITAEQTDTSEEVLWKGQITLPSNRERGQHRIVVEEYEHYVRRIDLLAVRSARLLGAQLANLPAPVATLSAASLRIQRFPHFSRYARLTYADTFEV